MLTATSAFAFYNAANDRLPPDGGCDPILAGYESPTQVHAIFSGFINFSDAIHYCFENWVESQSGGVDALENFDSRVTATIDLGGGAEPIHMTGPVAVLTQDRWGVSTGTFDTEILSMDLFGYAGGGLTGIQMRESPSLASTGQATVTDNGNGFTIDSFFDVNMEISINGGPFQPADAPITMNLVTLSDDVPVPALGNVGILTLVGSLTVAGVVLRRRARSAAS